MAIVGLIFICPAAWAITLNSEEQRIASYLTTASGQQRNKSAMVLDSRLSQVARARAMDMAKRRYFSHTNPDGNGPNTLVRATGYVLPAHYSTARSANNVESIGAGYANANAAWEGWMDSSGHKSHLLATDSFYREQTAYGVGYYSDSDSPYVRYYVVITAPPMTNVLSITSPASGARVGSSQVTINGLVSGASSVAQLQYRLENSSGTGAWVNGSLPSGSGAGSWSARISGLMLGNNTVRARTLRSDGTVIREATRTIRLAVLKPLNVSVVGDGKVSTGFLGMSQREVGARYTIAGIAGSGMIFGHWEGLPEAEGRDTLRPTQTFEMQEGLNLIAHFVPNPFPGRDGAYQGIIAGETHESSGLVRLRLAPSGVISGHVLVGGVRRNFVARLNSVGGVTISLPRPGFPALTVSLNLDLTTTDGAVSGAFSDGINTFGFAAQRAAAATPARYTVSIEPDAAAPASPQGFGYAVVSVAETGVARIAGSLADGRPFKASATLAADSRLALYVPLLGARGALTGTAEFTNGTVAGSAQWFEPARPGDTRHPDAFASSNTLTGSVYIAPAEGTRCVSPSTDGTGQLTFSAGNLESPLTQALVLETDHRFSCTQPSVSGLRIGINPISGRFAGSFVHPAGGVRTFSGVVLQGQNSVRGYFLGATESGAATLAF